MNNWIRYGNCMVYAQHITDNIHARALPRDYTWLGAQLEVVIRSINLKRQPHGHWYVPLVRGTRTVGYYVGRTDHVSSFLHARHTPKGKLWQAIP